MIAVKFFLGIACVRYIFICFVLLPSTTSIFLTILWAEESQFWPGAFTCPFSFHGDKVRWWLGDIYGIASIPIGMEDLCFALWLFLMCTQRWIRTWAQLSNSNPAQCGVSFWVRLAIHLPTTWAISFFVPMHLKTQAHQPCLKDQYSNNYGLLLIF